MASRAINESFTIVPFGACSLIREGIELSASDPELGQFGLMARIAPFWQKDEN